MKSIRLAIPGETYAAANGSISIGLRSAVELGIVLVVLAAVVFFCVRKVRRQRKEEAIKRLQRLPCVYPQMPQDSNDAYNASSIPHYTLSATTAVRAPSPAVNLQHPGDSARSYDSRRSPDEMPILSSAGDGRNNSWEALTAPIVAPSPSPVAHEKK
ncbi:hypothetical protein HDU81_010806 [Chytriomyces hyalinus]|nr:hypothetical protein HDU81_010806 [Chytriomyces hyalinus]